MLLKTATAIVYLVVATGPVTPASAQTPDGAQIFQRRCAACHSGAADARAPGPDALRLRTPDAVVESLVNGAMRVQGAQMSGADRRAVAEYVTGKAIGGDVTGSSAGRCPASSSLRNRALGPMWGSWSPTGANTRFQPAGQAGLAAGDVRRLTLKWAFGFPDASSGWAQPTVAGGRVFVGSQNGTVYSLDARTGCIYWTFSAGGGVRTAISIGPREGAPGSSESSVEAGRTTGAGGAVVYFGSNPNSVRIRVVSTARP